MAISKGKILWVDDEIELLRPHIIFLENRGYNITPVTSAEDALLLIKKHPYDVVLLDEMLLGMDGLTALTEIKDINPSLPVIMITKSEEESIMDEAIGGKIDDYLIKPVNPLQILLSCKKILESNKIAGERISRDYTIEFTSISQALMNPLNWEDWIQIYLKLCEWEIELDEHPGLGLRQTLVDQKRDCNIGFAKFIENNYINWVTSDERPLLSTDIISKFITPFYKKKKNIIFFVLDNLRLDQWLTMEPMLYSDFRIKRNFYYSILPSATPYARNAIFSGMFPIDLEKQHPDLWAEGNDDEHSLNRYEEFFLLEQLKRLNWDITPNAKYLKLLDLKHTKNALNNITSYANSPFTAIVINFVDFLAHSRSDSEILKEIAPDESAYRSLTKSWFEHSILLKMLNKLSKLDSTIIITSDHGSIRCMKGAKVLGDRDTSTNLRYKFGKNIKCSSKNAICINNPDEYKLPSRKINTNYLIAKEDYYFVYPTDYHYYLNYYKDSFQHGGISMEEMILPLIQLDPK